MPWQANPIRNKILVALIRRKGELIDDDLLRLIQKSGQGITTNLVNKELMDLEIAGVVTISQITKTRKRIKIRNKELLNKDLFK